MKASGLLMITAGLVAAVGWVWAQTGGAARARAALYDTSGRSVGTVEFEQTAQGLRLLVNAKGMPPGAHGLHVHASGDCRAGPDAQTGEIIPFGAAGGHFDPFETRNHGKPEDSAMTAHAGDIPMLEVGADGRGSLNFTTNKLALPDGKLTLLGRSVVVHAQPDDYSTDPAGGTGARIACGVILAPSDTLIGRYVVPGASAFPEGIVFDAARNRAYVGSASNGTLYRLNLGSRQAEILSLGGSPGRRSALGLKLDPLGRLLVAGGAEGSVAVVDANSGQNLAVLKSPPSPQAYINDLAVARDGFVYVTDSSRPVIWRFQASRTLPQNLESWLELDRTPIRYQSGVNLNGIVATPDGRRLIAVQTNTGQLWRIDTATRGVREVNLGGARLTGGDGLLLSGQRLYVIRNAQGRIDVVTLKADFSSGSVSASVLDANLRFPTTAALASGRLLVVNGQLDKQDAAPVLPFVVTSHNLGAAAR